MAIIEISLRSLHRAIKLLKLLYRLYRSLLFHVLRIELWIPVVIITIKSTVILIRIIQLTWRSSIFLQVSSGAWLYFIEIWMQLSQCLIITTGDADRGFDFRSFELLMFRPQLI